MRAKQKMNSPLGSAYFFINGSISGSTLIEISAPSARLPRVFCLLYVIRPSLYCSDFQLYMSTKFAPKSPNDNKNKSRAMPKALFFLSLSFINAIDFIFSALMARFSACGGFFISIFAKGSNGKRMISNSSSLNSLRAARYIAPNLPNTAGAIVSPVTLLLYCVLFSSIKSRSPWRNLLLMSDSRMSFPAYFSSHTKAPLYPFCVFCALFFAINFSAYSKKFTFHSLSSGSLRIAQSWSTSY